MDIALFARRHQRGAVAFQSMAVWGLIALSIALAYWSFGWPGVAFAFGGVVMWLLLHFTRMTLVLKRAADVPIGHTDSAVMLNVKLAKGQTLLHVIGLNRALGQLQTPDGVQPEVFRWIDPGDAWVDCSFVNGKLHSWEMHRPALGEPPAFTPPKFTPPTPPSTSPATPSAAPESNPTDATK